MAEKQRYTVSLPKHVTSEIEKRAKAVDATPTEYAADIIRWWYGQGCPPVTHDEIHLRSSAVADQIAAEMKKRLRPVPSDLNPWKLDPDAMYSVVDDEVVRPLMQQLGLPNLFAQQMHEHDRFHSFVAFDNHPTHWIVLHLWKGHPDAKGNGLMFEADPKKSVSRDQLLRKIQTYANDMGAKEPPGFSQLPAKNSPTAPAGAVQLTRTK